MVVRQLNCSVEIKQIFRHFILHIPASLSILPYLVELVTRYLITATLYLLLLSISCLNMVANDQPVGTFRYEEKPTYTTSNGCPINDPESSQRVGQNGPLLLQDFHLIDLLAHFDRERIPERVVHAKGSGAYGEFEVTNDISDLVSSMQGQQQNGRSLTWIQTSLDMLNGIGKKTKCVARFSTVGGEKGSADSARDPRGFSVKFYTEEGNWDWVFNNTPIFFLRDPSKFPIFIHTQKRNPQTNLKDATM